MHDRELHTFVMFMKYCWDPFKRCCKDGCFIVHKCCVRWFSENMSEFTNCHTRFSTVNISHTLCMAKGKHHRLRAHKLNFFTVYVILLGKNLPSLHHLRPQGQVP